MPWLDDLTTVMENAGVAVNGENLFTSTAAAVPKLSIATLHIIATPGSGPDATQDHRAAMRYPGAQFTARADNYDDAHDIAQAAYDACVAVSNETINGHLVRWIRPTQEPFDLGIDDRDQVRVVFNVIGNYSV